MSAETALPFSYGSIIVTGVENPSGGGNLTAAEIAECTRIYERIRSEYKMPFGRVEIDADSILEPGVPTTKTSGNYGMPEEDFTDYSDEAKTVPAIDDDLPF